MAQDEKARCVAYAVVDGVGEDVEAEEVGGDAAGEGGAGAAVGFGVGTMLLCDDLGGARGGAYVVAFGVGEVRG